MGRLLKSFGIYFAGNVINRLMGFVVTSIATYAITNQSDFGYYSISYNAINIIMTLVSVQAWMAVIRFVFDFEDKKYKYKVISTGYFIELIAFIIFTIGFIIVSSFLSIRDAIPLYLLSFGYVFVQSTQFACRGLMKNKLFVVSGIFGSLMQLLTSILLIFGFHMTSSALILAMAASYIGQALFIEFFLKSFLEFKIKNIDLKLAKKMLKYCVPTSLNYGTYWINQSANSLIIAYCLDQASAGIFAAAFKMNSLIGIIIMAFNYAFQEYSFSISKSDQRNSSYNFMLNAFCRFISCGMMVLLPITSVLFSIIIGPAYSSAKVLVPLLYLGSFFDSLQLFLSSIMQAEKKVNLMFVSQLIGSIITVTVMFTTIKYIGLQSAGLSMILCFLTISIIRVIGLRPNIKLKFPIFYFLHYSLVFILTVIVFLNFNEIVNLIYIIPLLIYSYFCVRNIINMLLKEIKSKLQNNDNNIEVVK